MRQMDNKNDDSAGSDSLDKSLQKKCVVDDVGQGEGGASVSLATSTGATVDGTTGNELGLPENSTKKQKTEKSVGDGGCSGGGGNGGGGGCSGGKSPVLTEHSRQTLEITGDPVLLNKETIQNSTSVLTAADLTAKVASSNNATPQPTQPTVLPAVNENNSSFAFETTVKQISKNLKETTLAESAIGKHTLEDSAPSISPSPSSSSSATNLTSPFNIEQGTAPYSSAVSATTEDALCQTQTDTSETSLPLGAATAESADEQDHRSKKVRFHPDVKENDGGNRVIPKKKKKFKSNTSGGTSDDEASTSSGARSANAAGGTDDEMELDEEEDLGEEEEEFDLEKTIAEAQDYLKAHPLTFVRPQDKQAGQLQSGLLEEEDLPQLLQQTTESSEEEEEDFYEGILPENGVERLLGKQIKCGKIEFLLRYADRPGHFWESEEWIYKHCPNLLNKYEETRDRRQERLMRHVAKRQNLRQRYTDF